MKYEYLKWLNLLLKKDTKNWIHLILKISAKNVNSKMNAGLNLKTHSTLASTILSIVYNVEAMTSKGLRSDELSTDTKLDASYNA